MFRSLCTSLLLAMIGSPRTSTVPEELLHELLNAPWGESSSALSQYADYGQSFSVIPKLAGSAMDRTAWIGELQYLEIRWPSIVPDNDLVFRKGTYSPTE